MKFDFETQEFINILKEMLEDYGRMALTDGKKCYSLWLDYAPQLPEEGELLKVFLELGLGKQVVELKNQSDEQRKAWSTSAVESMMQKGESRKDAECLVDAVMATLGWGVKPTPMVSKEPEIKPAKKPLKSNNTTSNVTKGSVSPKQKKEEPKKNSKKEKDNEQAPKKKEDPILNVAKQELLNRWRSIMEAYMPMAFPGRSHKVDFDNLSVPQDIMNVLNKRLKDSVQQYKFLAYGKSEFKGIWVVLTDSTLIVHSILGENTFFVVPYQRIRQMVLVGGSIFLKSTDDDKYEIPFGVESYYLVAMIRLMQGKADNEVITYDEWQGFFGYWLCNKDNTRCYIGMDTVPDRKKANLRAWMNRLYNGYRENEIIAVVDETVFGSCKDAIVITGNEIYHKSSVNLWRVTITDIVDIKCKATCIDIFLKDCSKVTLCHVGKTTYFEQSLETIVFIKQHSY